MFNKKKNETDITDYNGLALRTTEKKKENRKSIRNNHKSDQKKKSVKDLFRLLDDQTLQAAGPRLDEIIQSFQKELTYQNELLDYMREESILLRRKIQDETEKCSHIMEQFEMEIASVRKIAEEERRERRQLQSQIDSFQSNLLSPLPSPISITPTTKNHSKPQTSKTKRTQKKKANPS